MGATHWRYRTDGLPPFDPVVFDARALAARHALVGGAAAGRGNTYFMVFDGHPLVLRHYRRGGLVRHLSERRYVWTGLVRTRAVHEFELLRELEGEGLPVPSPFACAVTHHGLLWSGSLVTRRLPGRTLADVLAIGAASPVGVAVVPWANVGRCIARFHAAGVQHADLNAHNVMLDGDDVHLIDFDRATRRRRGAGLDRWRRRNVERLHRSLLKLATRGGRPFDTEGFATLERAWRDALAPRQGVGPDSGPDSGPDHSRSR